VRMGSGSRERHLIFDADHFVDFWKEPAWNSSRRRKSLIFFAEPSPVAAWYMINGCWSANSTRNGSISGGTTNDSGSATIRCCPLSRSISLKTIHSEANELGEFANTSEKPTGISSLPRRFARTFKTLHSQSDPIGIPLSPPLSRRRQQSGLSTTSPFVPALIEENLQIRYPIEFQRELLRRSGLLKDHESTSH